MVPASVSLFPKWATCPQLTPEKGVILVYCKEESGTGRDCWGKDTPTHRRRAFALWGEMTDGNEPWRGSKLGDPSDKWDPKAWPRDSASPGSRSNIISGFATAKNTTEGTEADRFEVTAKSVRIPAWPEAHVRAQSV